MFAASPAPIMESTRGAAEGRPPCGGGRRPPPLWVLGRRQTQQKHKQMHIRNDFPRFLTVGSEISRWDLRSHFSDPHKLIPIAILPDIGIYNEKTGEFQMSMIFCICGLFFDFWTFGKSPEALPSSVHTNFSIRIDPHHLETPIPGPDSRNLHFGSI